ncbi:MAG: hypothetical protein NTZ17_07665 [Phycisphaerae bacterium]|nr:hypothetical protein [Phycisphaerae bacterium]
MVAQNAVKHGLLAKEVVIKGEDPGEFEFYRDQMLAELAPVGQMEAMLAARVVSLSWRLQRAERLQGAAFDAMYEKLTAEPVSKLPALLGFKRAERPAGEAGRGDAELTLGRVVVRDYSNARVLDRLLMYERRIEQSLYRTIGELQKQRLMRELDPAAAGATPEGGLAKVSSLKLEVSSDQPTLPTSQEPLDGGTTNTAPVGAAAPAEMLYHSNIPSFRGSRHASGLPDGQEPSCETNPIAASSPEGQALCGTEVIHCPSQNGFGKTNPISPSLR